ncbi:MAG: triose-phosphate isomerase [Fidelibacterota bacterium]
MIKRPIIAGNWKMNKTPSEGFAFVDKVMKMVLDKNRVDIIFCPPFSALFNMKELFQSGRHFYLGAQNCHWETKGAFTGEISVAMLQDCDVSHVILGHSERRHIFGETNAWINRKIGAVLDGGLIPIFCIGETLEERNSGQTETVLTEQLQAGLDGIPGLDDIVIAYEPVWAIGTGVTATKEQAAEAHAVIRSVLAQLYSEEAARRIPILYGGSVKPANAGELIETEGVDGFLIGGAALEIDSFTTIIDEVHQRI